MVPPVVGGSIGAIAISGTGAAMFGIIWGLIFAVLTVALARFVGWLTH